jgi:hypothetical protein
MNFNPQNQNQLKALNIQNEKEYKIQYLNRDYFNGNENIETTIAKAIIDDFGTISFLVKDDYGMDKFIKDVIILDK